METRGQKKENHINKCCDYVHKGDLNWLFSILAEKLWERCKTNEKKKLKEKEKEYSSRMDRNEWNKWQRATTAPKHSTKPNGTTLSRLLKVILRSYTIHKNLWKNEECAREEEAQAHWEGRRSGKNMRYKLVPLVLSNIYRNISATSEQRFHEK